jgi:hypothetical protein
VLFRSLADLPTGAATPPQRLPRLALLEVLDADGRLLLGHDVQAWPLRLGRAIDNDVVLHDPHAAAHHATLDVDAQGRATLQVGTSRNGIRLDDTRGTRRLQSGERVELPSLARWHIGHSTLRLRLPADPLPEELTMAAVRPPPSGKLPVVLALLALAWQLGSLWLGGHPSSTWESYLLPLLASVTTLGLWVGVWGLASKLFTHRLTVFAHLRIALSWVLAGHVLDLALGLLAFAFDWPWASRIREPLGVLMLAGMVLHHLRVVLPAMRWRLHALVGTMAVVAVAGQLGLQWQRQDRLFDELYLSTLPPPALRLTRGESPASLVERLEHLEKPLIERAREQARQDLDP